MKFLADMGVSQRTLEVLRSNGHDATHLRDEKLHRFSDEDILKKARQEGRIVLTFDLDFGDLLAAGLNREPSAVIFRMNNQTPSVVATRLLGLLQQHSRELEKGAVAIVEDARYRIRDLPIADFEDRDLG